MKCPFCGCEPSSKRINHAVEFSCGMTFSSEFIEKLTVWPDRPHTNGDTDEAYKELVSYREHQPDACIRGERDRCLHILFRSANKWREMRAAGDALARHVAEDKRGQTARRLVEAWAEVSR